MFKRRNINMSKAIQTKMAAKRLCAFASVLFLVGCADKTQVVSSLSDAPHSGETSQSEESASSLNRQDGETSVYSYSATRFSEFKEFVSDFCSLNKASFVCFNFDNNAGIASEYTFEGYPSPSGLKREDVSKTVFENFEFSFSFLEERHSTVGVDSSRLMKVSKAVILDSAYFDAGSLSYAKQKQSSAQWSVSVYSNETLVSAVTLSFNGAYGEKDVDDYCDMLLSNAVLLKKE